MSAAASSHNIPVTGQALWWGRILSAIPAIMLLFSAAMKFARPPAVVEGFAKYGYPERVIVLIAVLEFACTVVYLIPRLSVLGAILLTGFLGGATASNVRVGGASSVIPAFLAAMAWGGLYLRDLRLRALIPLRSRRNEV
jgi:hypothetical protein